MERSTITVSKDDLSNLLYMAREAAEFLVPAAMPSSLQAEACDDTKRALLQAVNAFGQGV